MSSQIRCLLCQLGVADMGAGLVLECGLGAAQGCLSVEQLANRSDQVSTDHRVSPLKSC